MSNTNEVVAGSSIALNWNTIYAGSPVLQKVLLCGLSGLIVIPVMVDGSGALMTGA